MLLNRPQRGAVADLVQPTGCYRRFPWCWWIREPLALGHLGYVDVAGELWQWLFCLFAKDKTGSSTLFVVEREPGQGGNYQ